MGSFELIFAFFCGVNIPKKVQESGKTFFTTREQGSLEITEHTEGENSLTGKIIGAAIDVHRALGPGLLESAYETCLAYELRLRKLKIESQKAMPIFYKDVMLDCGYRADLIVNDEVIVEIKSIAGISGIYRNNLKNREFGKEAPQNFQA